MPLKNISCFLILSIISIVTVKINAQPLSVAAKIDQYLQQRRANTNIQGFSVAIVHRDTILLSKGYGTTSDGEPVTPTTPFAIASLSKGFTAMAVLQLVDSGVIDLDKPVIHYIPDLKTNDSRTGLITVRQLLNQSSGLSDKTFPELAWSNQPGSLDESFSRWTSASLIDTPGNKFRYHNPNYQLLALLVEQVSKQKFSEYLQHHIFSPLRMLHTHDHANTTGFYEHLSPGHIYLSGMPFAMKDPNWFVDGAAGLTSTSDDLARWLALHANQGNFQGTYLLSTEGLATMHRPPANLVSPYAMGWFVNGDNWYHSGILWTYSAEEMILAKEGYGIVLLFNGGINAYADYYSFLAGIVQIIHGEEPDVPSLPWWVLPFTINGLFVVALVMLIRKALRTKQWYAYYRQNPLWKSVLHFLMYMIPLFFVISIPSIITALSGRVLSAYRIFLTAPDIIIGLALCALLGLIILVTRIMFLFKQSRQ
jgi:CubicO group peptidase (beta-lactamase class C family)